MNIDCDGQIMIKLETQSEATSSFILTDPIEINNSVVLFKKKEKFLRNVIKKKRFQIISNVIYINISIRLTKLLLN